MLTAPHNVRQLWLLLYINICSWDTCGPLKFRSYVRRLGSPTPPPIVHCKIILMDFQCMYPKKTVYSVQLQCSLDYSKAWEEILNIYVLPEKN